MLGCNLNTMEINKITASNLAWKEILAEVGPQFLSTASHLTVKWSTVCRQHTIQGEQRGELPAVVHPGWIGRTRHPQVFIDGGGGDNVPVHGGGPPVAVRQAHPHHHPPEEPQYQSNYFHNRIHDPSLVDESGKSISRSQKMFLKHQILIKRQNLI